MAKPSKDQPTSMLIPRPVHAALKKEAVKQDLTVSQLLRRIIQRWFEGHTNGSEQPK